jgi:O-antigen/teichoic acid export membrane protein
MFYVGVSLLILTLVMTACAIQPRDKQYNNFYMFVPFVVACAVSIWLITGGSPGMSGLTIAIIAEVLCWIFILLYARRRHLPVRDTKPLGAPYWWPKEADEFMNPDRRRPR